MAQTLQKRAALYIRVSTQEQSQEGYSIQAQTEKLKAYCDIKDDMTFYKTYTDPGFTGSNIDRPAMRDLIRDAKAKRFDVVIVYKLDRLSRSQKDTLYLIEDVFNPAGIGFISINENFDTTSPFGKAMIGILSVFAQLEREQIKERTAMGRLERAKSGLWNGACKSPFGYKYINGKLEIDEQKANQVKEVFSMYLEDISLGIIIDRLKEKGHTGFLMYPGNIRSLLVNPIYTGKLKFKGEIYDGQHEPIIDDLTFEAAQKMVKKRSYKKSSPDGEARPFTAKYLLSGIIYCSHCGARYSMAERYTSKIRDGKRQSHKYYSCYSRTAKYQKTNQYMVKDANCKNHNWRMDALDAMILGAIDEILRNRAILTDIINEKIPAEKPENDNADIIANMESIDEKIQGLIAMYTAGHLTYEQIDKKVTALNTERERLQDTLKPIEDKEDVLTVSAANQILDKISKIGGSLDGLDGMEKRRFVHSLIKRIDIDDKDITIQWAFVA